MKCEICGKEMSPHGMGMHIKSHNLEIKDYYDMYMKKANEGFCLTCNKPTSFIKLSEGYDKYCSLSCNPKVTSFYICSICNREINNTNGGFTNHITNEHKLSIKEYYDSYMKKENEGICKKCGGEAKFINIAVGYLDICDSCQRHPNLSKNICKICNKKITKLGNHLYNSHPDINPKDYYDRYIKQPGEGICPVCNKETNFIGLTSGYNQHCSMLCSQKDPNVRKKVEETSIKRYGGILMGSAKIKEKAKETNRKKYGVDYASQNENIKNKVKKTTIEHYGGIGWASKELRDKTKQTCLEKYGNENYHNREKAEQTNLEKYGAKNVYASDYGKQKIKETNLERYGVEHVSQNPEILAKAHETQRKNNNGKLAWNTNKQKETMLEKYGGTGFGSNEIQEKIKETTIQKYGSTSAMQNEEVKNKVKNTNIERYGVSSPLSSKELREKGIQTSLEKYGTAYPNQSEIVKDKIKQTNIDKYGVDNIWNTPENRRKSVEAAAQPEIRENAWKTRHEHNKLDDELNNADE